MLVAENERECRAHFNVIHIPSGYKADFYPSQRDPFFAWAWRTKRDIELRSGPVHYAPPEYIIVWKVAYFAEGGGEKHIRDTHRMLELSSAEIDSAILHEELNRRGLANTFQTMLR